MLRSRFVTNSACTLYSPFFSAAIEFSGNVSAVASTMTVVSGVNFGTSTPRIGRVYGSDDVYAGGCPFGAKPTMTRPEVSPTSLGSIVTSKRIPAAVATEPVANSASHVRERSIGKAVASVRM